MDSGDENKRILQASIQELLTHEGATRLVLRAIEMLEPEKIVLFGSRARGTARPTSDFDIAVFLDNPDVEWARFVTEAKESPEILLPVDWVDANHASVELLKSIQEEGVLLYEKKRKFHPGVKKT
jgi:predicted nucleotidyltransferase